MLKLESLKHDLSHLLSISLGIERSLGKKNRVFFKGDTKLIVESMVPYLLHVIPIVHNAMLDRVFQR